MLCESSMLGYVTNRQPICNIFNFYWTPPHVTLEGHVRRGLRTAFLWDKQTPRRDLYRTRIRAGRRFCFLWDSVVSLASAGKREEDVRSDGVGLAESSREAGKLFPSGRRSDRRPGKREEIHVILTPCLLQA